MIPPDLIAFDWIKLNLKIFCKYSYKNRSYSIKYFIITIFIKSFNITDLKYNKIINNLIVQISVSQCTQKNEA